MHLPRALIRALVCLLWACYCGRALAADALVLIRTEFAGPQVDIHNYTYGEWILWPDNLGETTPLLSLSAGVDLSGSTNASFLPDKKGQEYYLTDPEELRKRSVMTAAANLREGREAFAVSNEGRVSVYSLLLAVHPDGTARVLSLQTSPPPHSLLFFEARSWDEVAMIAAKCKGRVLTIEYPPQAKDHWSRYWFFGKGWPAGLPIGDTDVPGLVQARSAMQLLLHPEDFRWEPNRSGEWGGANRWFETVRQNAPFVLGCFLLFAAYIFGCGVYCVVNERRAEFAWACLQLVMLWPAAVLLAGQLSLHGGLDAWPLWLTLSAVGLTFLVGVLRIAFTKVHPMMSLSLVGLAVSALCDPRWSLVSQVFGRVQIPFSTQGAGALLGYCSCLVAFAANGKQAWFSRTALLLLCGAPFFVEVWWAESGVSVACLPLLGLLLGEGLLSGPLVLLTAAIPFLDGLQIMTPLVFAPYGLYPTVQSSSHYNIGRFYEVLASPGMGLLFGSFLAILPISDRFFFRQMRRVLRSEPRVTCLFWGAAATAAMSLCEPYLLETAALLWVGGCCLLLSEALRTL